MSPKARRSAIWFAVHAHWHFAAGVVGQDCKGTSSVSAEQWSSALDFLSGSASVSALAVNHEAWSQSWVQLAQGVASDFYGNLEHCLEGSVAAFLHALPAFDKAEGDALSLEVVKHLHHHLGGRELPASEGSGWQQHWLAAVASLLRFVYAKWVNVPQDEVASAGDGPAQVALPAEVLLRHHKLAFRSYLDDFVRSGVYDMKIAENSVLYSEAFAFAAFCRLHEVNLVLESGVYRGFSSEVWSHVVEEVVAVDLFPDEEVMRAAEERLRHRPNVKVLRGNGKTLLPELLAERPTSRAAVFIDGPKGELAIRLALALRKHPQVAFVAVHDMAPYRGSLRGHGAYFFSDEPWFQAEYGHLDAPFRERPDLEAGGTMAFLS